MTLNLPFKTPLLDTFVEELDSLIKTEKVLSALQASVRQAVPNERGSNELIEQWLETVDSYFKRTLAENLGNNPLAAAILAPGLLYEIKRLKEAPKLVEQALSIASWPAHVISR